MANKKQIETIQDLASALVKMNPVLTTTVKATPGANYRPIEAIIKPNIRAIGQSLYNNKFINTRDLIFAIINEVEGTNKVTLKLS